MRNKNYIWMNKEDLWKEGLWTKGYDSFKVVLLKSINKIIKSNLIWFKWVDGWATEGRKRERKAGREGVDRRKKGREEPSVLFWASCDLASWRKWGPGRIALGKSCACYMHCTWQGGAGSGTCQVIAIAWCVLHFTSAFSASVSPS